MKKSLVSVIVPVYNIKEYVGKCLDSLARQDYGNLEVVMVDDGSTDGSSEVCDEYVGRDKRFRVVYKENGGLSEARNVGINEAKGELICLVDGDDRVRDNFVSELVLALETNGADIAVCGFNKEHPANKVTTGEQAAIDLLVKQENMEIVAWNKIYRKSIFVDNNIWYPVGKKYEDTLTTYKLLAAAGKVAYTSKSLYIYNDAREGSIMNSGKKEEQLMAREKAAEEAVKYFSGNTAVLAGSREGLIAASKVAVLLSKYAFLDFAISNKIDKKYQKEILKWLKQNWKLYKKNKKLSRKLRAYGVLSTTAGGILYILFRKMKHEK